MTATVRLYQITEMRAQPRFQRSPVRSIEDLRSASEPEPNSGCWLWMRAVNGKGYGSCQFNGKVQLAHRVAYLLALGDPAGLVVCHRCDVPSCVNPDHLFLGTVGDNNRDRDRKGRASGGRVGRSDLAARVRCVNGHDYTPENTGRQAGGRRYCKACKREQLRARRARSS
jgi:hypothetical protein